MFARLLLTSVHHERPITRAGVPRKQALAVTDIEFNSERRHSGLHCHCVIPKSRAFASGTRDLAWPVVVPSSKSSLRPKRGFGRLTVLTTGCAKLLKSHVCLYVPVCTRIELSRLVA